MLGLVEMLAGVLVRDPVMEWMEGEEVTSGENFIGDVGGVATAEVSFLKQSNFTYLFKFLKKSFKVWIKSPIHL